ncbi:N-Acyltransferase (NAT) [Legionella busanensis]|uniref:N-Acyltransferase (NAT) n=1 Tax=Legionella busanensis TaxID=190655 RepID=A0A378JJA3_9GAMM|nr:GNAT family N-acetyltransferase [Legionella busanensis]STX51386.1 N-Acyltransferase (NAT) [Legionella busanensis]
MESTYVRYVRSINLPIYEFKNKFIQIRRFTMEDAEIVLKWRNHTTVRSQFIDTTFIPLDEHKKWCQKKLEDNLTLLLIGEDLNQQAIGTIRYDVVEREANISIYIDPDLTGKGYGEAILLQSIKYVQPLNIFDNMIAQVKSTNIASRRLFEKCNFLLTQETVKI